jgi:hypothetical protein
MTPRERFVALLDGQVPDRLPLLADLSYWYSARQDERSLDARYQGDEGYLRLHEDLGCVFYYDYAGGGVLGESLEDVDQESFAQGPETVHRVRTRAGELTGRTRYLPDSHCRACTEYMVKRPEDLRAVRAFCESRRFSPRFDEYLKRRESIGQRGLPSALLPRSPLPALLVEWAGVELTTYLSVDARPEFEMTLQCMDAALDPAYEIACRSPAPLFHFTDNLSSEIVGGLYARYLAPFHRKRIRQFHDCRKKAAVHLDGTIRGLLGPLAATGVDAVESLTTAPVGDLSLENLRAEAGDDRVVLWGGLPGALFSVPYGKVHVQRQVEAIRRIFGRGGRFIPGTADQVPPDADIELVRLASEKLAAG